ncbi:hypothetical protein A3B60_01280 [Candidatus Peregrinibacteria bacterium RIFCSPLOWO2_01_FULL_39_12]|nr:MAG: hypothetical protein A3B60_01280 [Candidatus Peregrinibacteria bacterium RIFCSPLOWO2_01_FULL_39_12]OGJ43203.1 MAG: hypothetical protein A3I58_00315 [Candidatus Peregrinibacteria bacterium RIFCSPLOWO2_02_FULL_39_10]
MSNKICKNCNQTYEITDKDLVFYKKIAIPPPTFCPDCRYKERSSKRNPFKLWERSCAKCNKKIHTTYNPNRPETVYCEKCYLENLQ